jgi:hypothetical protein
MAVVSFFGKMPILRAECLMNQLHLKTITQVADALAYYAEKECIHSNGILTLKNNRTLYISPGRPPSHWIENFFGFCVVQSMMSILLHKC